MSDSEESKAPLLDASAQLVSQVAIKPPQFDEAAAAKWFRILESMFATSRITQSGTKFNHVLSHLPFATVNKILSVQFLETESIMSTTTRK